MTVGRAGEGEGEGERDRNRQRERETACNIASVRQYRVLSWFVIMTAGFSSLMKTLERQKLSADSMKRPLMMAALNGLYVARMPVPENPHEDASAKANTDERVRHSTKLSTQNKSSN